MMFNFSFKNLFAKPARTFLAIATVAISIILLLTLLGFYIGYNKAMKDELNNFGAQMLAVPKGCPYSSTTLLLHGGVIPNKLPMKALEDIRAIKNVTKAEGIVMGTGEIEGNQQVVYGITPGFEKLRSSWTVEGAFPTIEGSAVLGYTLANKLNLKVGDSFTIIGLAQDKTQQEELGGTYPAPGTKVETYKTEPRTLQVVGLLNRTGSSEDNFVIVSDSEARIIIDLNGFTAIAAQIDDKVPNAITDVASQIEKITDTQPVTINQVAQTVAGLIDSARTIMLSVTIVAILACAVVVAGASMMGVIERSKEIGMMRAIGASPFQVSVSVMLEVVMLTFFGGLLGVLLTIALQSPLDSLIRTLIPNAPLAKLVVLPPDILALSVGVAVVLGIIAAIPPLISVAKAPPLRMAGS